MRKTEQTTDMPENTIKPTIRPTPKFGSIVGTSKLKSKNIKIKRVKSKEELI